MGPAARPVLSIVTVTLDDATGLELTLRSIGEQNELARGTVEHVIVDGGSRDRTVAVVEQNRTPHSTFLSEPDRNLYDAMNKGLRLARGQYVMFLNSGDCFSGTAAAGALVDALRGDPLWLVAQAVDHHGGTRPPRVVANLPHSWWRHAIGVQPHCHQSTVFDRDLLLRMGGHDDRLGFAADFDLVLRWGAIAPPAELRRVVVDYQGGGISEQRMRDIPHELARIRESRLSLSGAAQRLNRTWAGYQRARVILGEWLGR